MHISKQSVHQYLDRYMRSAEEEGYLYPLIEEIRTDHPTMSCRSMYYLINPTTLGRDKFESLCKTWGFVTAKKPCYKRTTDSSGVIRFDNLTKDLTLTSINQLYSSDITYFEINNRFYYITFIIDCFSRYIVGYSVSERLTTEQTTYPALEMAIKARKSQWIEPVIFHSDRGGQYYDKEFLALTAEHKMLNSMCEYAYENPYAERINGTIKNNYLKHWNIKSYKELLKSVDRAVPLYNTVKPHKSLKRMSPENFEKKHLLLTRKKLPIVTESLDA